MSTPKKTIHKRSKDGKTLDGSISLGGKTAPTARTAPTGKAKTTVILDTNPIRNNTDISKLNLVKRNNFPQELYKTFPRNMDSDNGILLYEKVAESMFAFQGDLIEWRISIDMGPSYDDMVGIWKAINDLGVWNSRDIRSEVADRGENVNDLEETCMGYLTESYEWAYDCLMDYVGGYSYVTNKYGAWGEWILQGTKVEEDHRVFDSPADKRDKDRRNVDGK